MVADAAVTPNPAINGKIKENELSSWIKIFVNWYRVGYTETSAITLRISLICLNFLFNQLLNKIPTNIVPIPIHKNGIIPETN